MPFVQVPGFHARLYIPEEKEGCARKHHCEDCYQCQMCSDARCNLCRKQGSSPGETEVSDVRPERT